MKTDPSSQLAAYDADGRGVPTPALAELLALFELEALGDDVFRTYSPAAAAKPIFGGQLVAQTLVAAANTAVKGLDLHSLRSSFLSSGDPAEPLTFAVERLRDGRRHCVRRVVVRQRERPVFELSASFQAPGEGREHTVIAAPGVPGPQEWPGFHERLGTMAGRFGAIPDVVRPFDIRYVGATPWQRVEEGPSEPSHRVWIRTAGPLPDRRLSHQAALGYASDLTLADSLLVGHGLYWGRDPVAVVSLTQSMWFHQPFRADEWLLYDCFSPIAHGGRALVSGRFFTQAGRLVASVTQEMLFRIRD